VSSAHVNRRRRRRRWRWRAQTNVLQQHVSRVVVVGVVVVVLEVVMMVLVVMRMMIHARPGRVTEGAGRMLTVVGLMVMLSFDRKRQHGTASGQVLPASLVHSAVARSRIAHPALKRQRFVINIVYIIIL